MFWANTRFSAGINLQFFLLYGIFLGGIIGYFKWLPSVFSTILTPWHPTFPNHTKLFY
jgi:hypothetical protein